MQRGFIPIYLLVLLLVGGLAGYYYFTKSSVELTSTQPTPTVIQQSVDETANPDLIGANWKTYTNSKYGYSLDIPPVLQAVDITDEPTLSKPSNSNTSFDEGWESVPFKEALRRQHEMPMESVVVLTDKNNKIENIVKKKPSPEFSIPGIRIVVKQSTAKVVMEWRGYSGEKVVMPKLENLDVWRISSYSNVSGNGQAVIIEKNGFVYEISNITWGQGMYNEYFDQILSTFKFTN